MASERNDLPRNDLQPSPASVRAVDEVSRQVFRDRLREASAAARTLGQEFVTAALPEPLRYRAFLNRSKDQELRPGEVVYANDPDGPLKLSEDEVLRLLWRAGKVPEWIEVCTCDALFGFTVLQLLVCGRFTANEHLLYHQQEGRAPFHVTRPPLPFGYPTGHRFGVRVIRAQCRTLPPRRG